MRGVPLGARRAAALHQHRRHSPKELGLGRTGALCHGGAAVGSGFRHHVVEGGQFHAREPVLVETAHHIAESFGRVALRDVDRDDVAEHVHAPHLAGFEQATSQHRSRARTHSFGGRMEHLVTHAGEIPVGFVAHDPGGATRLFDNGDLLTHATSVVGARPATKPDRPRCPYDSLVITRHPVDGTTWIDVVDPTNEELDELAAEHGMAERTFDEAHRRAARPTMQRFPDHLYMVAFSGELAEIDMWAGDDWFATVRRHDAEGQEWAPTTAIERARRLREISPGMMLALVLEDLVDGYFDSADLLEDKIEAIEDRIFGDAPPEGADSAPIAMEDELDVQEALFDVRRELIRLRRAVLPLREVLQALLRSEVQWVQGDALVVCRDTFDKLLRAIDLVDELRELVGNAVEAHLAVMSNQMNLVMKQLTAWGSIVFGATLIAGIYGMNFAHMPELDWKLGYPFALGMMLTMSIILWRWFKRNDWL